MVFWLERLALKGYAHPKEIASHLPLQYDCKTCLQEQRLKMTLSPSCPCAPQCQIKSISMFNVALTAQIKSHSFK